MSEKLTFEIGHVASLKSKITPEGFTHDWELYVRGCDSADISHCIEKVVFYLHESFPKPKRVFKEPPYSLKESGYGGFVLPIDIYFKNRDDPKKITCSYDLTLQNTGTITNVMKKTQLFQNPSEKTKKTSRNKSDKEKKEKNKRNSPNREKSDARERDRKRSIDQKQKEERPSSKASDKIDLKKEKDIGNRNQKDKVKVNDVKQSNSADHLSDIVTNNANEKKSEKDPDRKHKHKKKDKNKDKEKEHANERKKKKSSKYKEDVKISNASPPKKSVQTQSSQLPQQQTKVSPLRALINEMEENASSDSDDDHSKPSISYTQTITGKLIDNAPKLTDDTQLTKTDKQLDKGEKSTKRAKKEIKSSDKEDKKRKRKSKDETPSPAFSEPPQKHSKKEENGALSWRSDIRANFLPTSQNTPPPHRIDSLSRSSPLPSPSRSSSFRATPSPLSTNTTHHQLSPNLQQQRHEIDYMSQLKELQHNIMSLEDSNELQPVVEMIIETGNYEIIGEKSFDFDLCELDRTTVQRLQSFFLFLK